LLRKVFHGFTIGIARKRHVQTRVALTTGSQSDRFTIFGWVTMISTWATPSELLFGLLRQNSSEGETFS